MNPTLSCLIPAPLVVVMVWHFMKSMLLILFMRLLIWHVFSLQPSRLMLVSFACVIGFISSLILSSRSVDMLAHHNRVL